MSDIELRERNEEGTTREDACGGLGEGGCGKIASRVSSGSGAKHCSNSPFGGMWKRDLCGQDKTTLRGTDGQAKAGRRTPMTQLLGPRGDEQAGTCSGPKRHKGPRHCFLVANAVQRSRSHVPAGVFHTSL